MIGWVSGFALGDAGTSLQSHVKSLSGGNFSCQEAKWFGTGNVFCKTLLYTAAVSRKRAKRVFEGGNKFENI